MTGKTLSGKYEIKREVGRGGMGVIYEALHTALNRTVAIKVLHAQFTNNIDFLDRFKREARAMARLDHKNIIRVFDVLEDKGTHFIIMEYFKGRNLLQILREKKKLPQRAVLSIAYQIAKALSYAHEKGVIHRDIKPANIIISKNGTAKIADFGIAATMDEVSLTAANHIIGTPEYMSLEQSRGEPLDGRSDLYALGMVMYEMLCGHTYYAGITGADVLKKLAYDESEFQLHFENTVVPSLQALVKNLLKKNKVHRIADTSVLIQQIKTSKLELKTEKKTDFPKEHLKTKAQKAPTSFSTRRDVVNEQQATVIARKQKQRPPAQAQPATKKWPKRIAALVTITLVFVGITSISLKSGAQKPNTPLELETQLENKTRPLHKKQHKQTINLELEEERISELKEAQSQIEKEKRAQRKTTIKLAQIKKEREKIKRERKKQEALLRSELIKLGKEKTRTKKESLALNKAQRERKALLKKTQKKKNPQIKKTTPKQITAVSPAKTLDSLGAILSRLTVAYEKKDLDALQKMTAMSKSRAIFLKQIFKNYKTVSVSVTGLSIEDEQAEAIITITGLRTHKNKKIWPPDRWKHAKLIIPKKKGQWDKALW